MAGSFGARLRQRREDQHIALDSIAEETKIKLSLLEALERDDVSAWPSGIFRRAYIRAYAQAINLSPDTVVREFLAIYPEPPEGIATAFFSGPEDLGSPSPGGPPTRLRHMVTSALGSISRRRAGGGSDAAGSSQASIQPTQELDAQLPTPTVTPNDETGSRVEQPRTREAMPAQVDFLAVAQLCTDLGRADSGDDLRALVHKAARILHASGLIVWTWDASLEALRPALVHGYSESVLAQVPLVTRDADNATAAAFRSGHPCAVEGAGRTSGALVVPLMTSGGCKGVLALELQDGSELARAVRAGATILAAMLAQVVGGGGTRGRSDPG